MTTHIDREPAPGNCDQTGPEASPDCAPSASAATGGSVCGAHCWYHPDEALGARLVGVAVLLYDGADRDALIVDLLDQPATHRFATIPPTPDRRQCCWFRPRAGRWRRPDTATALLADSGVAGDVESHVPTPPRYLVHINPATGEVLSYRRAFNDPQATFSAYSLLLDRDRRVHLQAGASRQSLPGSSLGTKGTGR